MNGLHDFYKENITKTGEAETVDKTIEELTELIDALSSTIFRKYHIHEEIADVQNMIDQLRMIFDAEEIDKIRTQKLRRRAKEIGSTTVYDLSIPNGKNCR